MERYTDLVRRLVAAGYSPEASVVAVKRAFGLDRADVAAIRRALETEERAA